MPQRRPSIAPKDDIQESVEARVRSGAYASADEVLRAGLAALGREEEALAASMRRRIDEALAEPGEDVPAEQVIAELRALHRTRTEGKRGS